MHAAHCVANVDLCSGETHRRNAHRTGIMSMSVDEWVEIAKDCQYLPENELKVCRATVVLDAWLTADGAGTVRQGE